MIRRIMYNYLILLIYFKISEVGFEKLVYD